MYPFPTLLPAAATGLRTYAKAHAEQIRSVAVERIGPAIGRVPAKLDDALRLYLQLHLSGAALRASQQ